MQNKHSRTNTKLGEILRSKREELGFDLEQISNKLKIPLKYLQALESGNYEILPPDVYVRCFLKLYCQCLCLDVKDIYNLYKTEVKVLGLKKKTNNINFNNFFYRLYNFVVIPKVIRNVIIICVILLVLAYLGLGMRNILMPPELIIFTPKNDSVIYSNFIDIKGKTTKNAILLINDQNILKNQDGSFQYKLNLQKGLNIIKITSQNSHGKKRVLYRRVFVKELEERENIFGLKNKLE